VRDAVAEQFEVELGRCVRTGRPHPKSMYQVKFAPELFGRIVPWLMLITKGSTYSFISTDDDVGDHTHRRCGWEKNSLSTSTFCDNSRRPNKKDRILHMNPAVLFRPCAAFVASCLLLLFSSSLRADNKRVMKNHDRAEAILPARIDPRRIRRETAIGTRSKR